MRSGVGTSWSAGHDVYRPPRSQGPGKVSRQPCDLRVKVECDIAKRLEECSTRASVAVFTLDPHVRDMVYDACGRFKSASDLRKRDFAGALAAERRRRRKCSAGTLCAWR